MSTKYILDEHGEPAICEDVLTWAEWYSKDERRIVRRNTFERNGTEITVSTVFLGLDHNWGSGPPVLWETMTFGLPEDEAVAERYTSRDEAIANHERLVDELLSRAKK